MIFNVLISISNDHLIFRGIPPKETGEDLNFSTDYTPIELTQWDPMSDAYTQKAFNNYTRPNFDADFKAQYLVPEG